jgi:hypothetical protein
MKKKYVLVALAFGLSLSAKVMAQVPNYVPANGLVGWWPFNGNANDESGNSFVVNSNDASLTSDRNGINNKAYSFATGNRIILGYQIPQVNGLPSLPMGNSPRTISLWFQSTCFKFDAGGTMVPCSMLSYGNHITINGEDITLQINSGNLQLYAPTNFQNGLTGPNVIDGNWHYAVYTFNGSAHKLYLDNVLVSSNNYSLNTIDNNQPYMIFGGSTYASSDYNGKLDDIGIWDRVLTNEEISKLFNPTLGLPAEMNDNLFLVYPNPTNENLSLGVSNDLLGKQYLITDFSGRIILQGKINVLNQIIELTNVYNGSYLLQVENSNAKAIKIVKQ